MLSSPKNPVTFVRLERIVHETGTMDFSEIYKRYVRDVHRFLVYLLGSYTLADDLTAATFVLVLCERTDLGVDTVIDPADTGWTGQVDVCPELSSLKR